MTSTRKEVSETHLQLARRVYADSPVKVIGDMEAFAVVAIAVFLIWDASAGFVVTSDTVPMRARAY